MTTSARIAVMCLPPLIGALIYCPARAAEIDVPLDQVRSITLETAAKTVFIGNPVIADVTVIDATHVFVLGKSFGVTNIIALDSLGRETMNEQVAVTERPGTAVTVQGGIARTTLMCVAGHCEAAPAPGDDATSSQQRFADPPYEALTGQAERRESAGKAAGGK